MASLYLSPELEPADAEVGARVSLTGDEARHAVTVARVRVGERIAIGDGSGFVVWGPVVAASAAELAIQAATELGVAGVIPWAAERSVSRWEAAKAAKGRERWASIVREASKQAIRSRVPDVAALAGTTELAALPGRLLVLDPLGDIPLTEVPLDGQRVTLVVGPEGGIAPREFDALVASGALRVRLGAEVLRTSTAGPAALAVLNARLGRW